MVYLILFFMGISLAFLDNLPVTCWQFCIIPPSALPLFYSQYYCVVVAGARSAVAQPLPEEKLPSRIAMALESLKLCGV